MAVSASSARDLGPLYTPAYKVLALTCDRASRDRLRAAMPPVADVRVACSLRDLEAGLLRADVGLVVLDLAAAPVGELGPWVAAVRRTHPGLPIVAYGAVTARVAA